MGRGGKKIGGGMGGVGGGRVADAIQKKELVSVHRGAGRKIEGENRKLEVAARRVQVHHSGGRHQIRKEKTWRVNAMYVKPGREKGGDLCMRSLNSARTHLPGVCPGCVEGAKSLDETGGMGGGRGKKTGCRDWGKSKSPTLGEGGRAQTLGRKRTQS